MKPTTRFLLWLMAAITAATFGLMLIFQHDDKAAYADTADNSSASPSALSPQKDTRNAVGSHTENLLLTNNGANRIKAFVEGCLPRNPPPDISVSDRQLSRYFDSLKDHNDQAGRYLYAMFAAVSSTEQRIARLLDYRNAFPGDEGINVEIIRRCAATDSCEARVVEEIITADADNGELWLHIANYYAVKQNHEKVNVAINRLLQTNAFTNHFASSLNDYVRLTHPPVDVTPYQLYIAATGHLAADSTYPSALVNWCQANAAHETRAGQCFQLGRHLRRAAKTHKYQQLGTTLQALTAPDDEAREQLLLQTTSTNDAAHFTLAAPLMAINDRLLYHWLHDFTRLGETPAQRNLVKSVFVAAESGVCDS